MGAVYLAEDIKVFGRQWIVKEMLLPSDPGEQREAESNFRREAELLAKLRHPRIPEIHDYFLEGGKYYLVMDLAEGENLEERLQRLKTPLTEKEVINYAIQVCEALEYLGKQNPPVIHRDIKPANIVVDKTGQIRLVDFGIARAKPNLGAAVSRDTSLWGTKGYAPPEQHAGQTEPRSDVYALGATMHHLLTGHDPRDPAHKTFEPLDTLVPSVSSALSRIVEQMLNPVPSNRPDAGELMEKFKALLNIEPLIFSSGQVAYSIQELVRLCDCNRPRAIQYLRDRDIENWLKKVGRPDLAAEAKTIRVEINRRKKTTDPIEALNRLLHILDPSLPEPQLSVSKPTANLVLLRGTDTSINVTVRSNGRYLGGEILAKPTFYISTASRFECTAPTFSTSIVITIAADNAQAGPRKATIILKPHRGYFPFDIDYSVVDPLHLGPQVSMNNPSELVQASLQHWNDAASHFENGDISGWLRSWQRVDLASKADQLRLQFGSNGLAELLYVIDPRLERPSVSVVPPHVDLGNIEKGEQVETTFTLTNESNGILHGSLSSPFAHLSIDPKEIVCLPHQSTSICTNIDTGRLPGNKIGLAYSAVVQFDSNAPILTIPLTWSIVHAPVLSIKQRVFRVRLKRDSTPRLSIEVMNAGGDILDVEALASTPWLIPDGSSMTSVAAGSTGTLGFLIDTRHADEKQTRGSAHVVSNGGEADVAVELLFPHRFPWLLYVTLLFISLLFALVVGGIAVILEFGPMLSIFLAGVCFAAGVVVATTIACVVYFMQ